MRRAFHIAGKDVRIWSRDVVALGILIGMPIVLILILGSALGGGGMDSRIAVAVVNLDAGSRAPGSSTAPGGDPGVARNLGEELQSTLRDSDRLGELFALEVVRDEAAARDRVAEGELAGALVIPRDFTSRIESGTPVELEVVADPGAEISAGILTSVVRSFAAQYSAASVAVQTVMAAAADAAGGLGDDASGTPLAPAPPPVTPEALAELRQAAVDAATAAGADRVVRVEDTVADRDVQLRALDFFGVSMTSMFLMFGAMFGAFSTIKERREQTLSRLLSTPTSAMSVTGGKMIGIFVLGMGQFVVLFLFTRFAFQVNWGNDLVAVFAIAAAEMLAVTGLAVLIAGLARTERGAGGLGPLIIQVQALIGGAFFTIAVLPQWLQPIRYFSVIGWALDGWQTVQLRGGTLGDVLVPIGALLGFAILFFALGAWLTAVRR